MDQTRLNFISVFYNFNKNYNVKSHYNFNKNYNVKCNFLDDVCFDIEPEDQSKNKNNNTYFEKKKLKKKFGLLLRVKLIKVYNNNCMCNILFF